MTINAPCDPLVPCCGGGVCTNGVCTDLCAGVTCTASDSCHDAGVCSPQTGICSDRLPAGASAFDAPRLLDAAGSSPIPAPLPGGSGAAVVYSVGNTVWVTVQAY